MLPSFSRSTQEKQYLDKNANFMNFNVLQMTSRHDCFLCHFTHLRDNFPREDAGGLSREYILRIPSVS